MSRHPLAAVALSVLVLLTALTTLTEASASPRGPRTRSASPAASAPAPAPSASAADSTPEEPPLPWQEGPKVIDLGHGATIALPEGRRFLGMPDAGKVMEKLGNLNNESLLGIVLSSAEEADYLVSVRYEDEGYIKDDEAIDSKAILASIQGGEKEYNEERQKRGFPPIHADGWSEEPRYDKKVHQLVWALLVSSNNKPSVNLNTRVLGRKGYVSVNLIAAPEDLPR